MLAQYLQFIEGGKPIVTNAKTCIYDYIMIITVPLIWSGNFIWGKILIESIPVFSISTIRFFIAALIFIYILHRKKLLKMPPKSLWLPIIFLGITGVVLYSTLIYLGLIYTTSINATIINAFAPIMVSILSIAWLHERLTVVNFFGFVISIIGVFIITFKGSLNALLSLNFNAGDIIIFAATFCWALYSIVIKKTTRKLTPLETTAYTSIIGAIILIPPALWEWYSGYTYSLTQNSIAGLLYISIFCSVIAYSLWTRSVAKLGPSIPSGFLNLVPLFTAAMAVLILKEELHIHHVTGSIFVLLGLYISTGRSRTKKLEDPSALNS